jgi:hypothetical protein
MEEKRISMSSKMRKLGGIYRPEEGLEQKLLRPLRSPKPKELT